MADAPFILSKKPDSVQIDGTSQYEATLYKPEPTRHCLITVEDNGNYVLHTKAENLNIETFDNLRLSIQNLAVGPIQAVDTKQALPTLEKKKSESAPESEPPRSRKLS